MADNNEPKWISNKELQLEIKALRSDVKLWILAAVALNQFLASIEIPSSLSAAAVAGLAIKTVLGAVFRG